MSCKLHEIVYIGKISCKYAHVSNIILSTTWHKVSQNSIERLRGNAMTHYFNSTFNLGKISMFKKGVIRQKNESEFPENMHIYTVGLSKSYQLSFTKFCYAVSEELR